MKVKILNFIIILTMVSTLLIGTVFAAPEDVCRVSVNITPNNPEPGDNVTIKVSLSEIKEPISSVKFALNYSKDIFEVVSSTAEAGWNCSVTENTYVITTSNSEATNKTGTIVTIVLKVKQNVTPGTQTQITFTSISVSTDDDSVDGFDNLEQTITISTPTQTQQGNQVENNKVIDNEVINNQIVENNVKENKIIQNQVVNSLPVQKVNNINEGLTKDEEKPKLPKTGENFVIPGLIIGLSIISAVSYVIYRRNKI